MYINYSLEEVPYIIFLLKCSFASFFRASYTFCSEDGKNMVNKETL